MVVAMARLSSFRSAQGIAVLVGALAFLCAGILSLAGTLPATSSGTIDILAGLLLAGAIGVDARRQKDVTPLLLASLGGIALAWGTLTFPSRLLAPLGLLAGLTGAAWALWLVSLSPASPPKTSKDSRKGIPTLDALLKNA